jgi:hypothetical protein
MRTTFDLDDDVLAAAKALAKVRQTTAGRIISDTMRRAIQLGLADAEPQPGTQQTAAPPPHVFGFSPLTAPGQHIVTDATVRALRDETGD